MGKNDFPRHYRPMLASTRQEPFDDPEWQYEVKWDGYRMLAYVKNGKVSLRTRNNVDYTLRFQHIAKEFAKWKHEAILDGEITVLNENGVSHFNSLENWNKPIDGDLRYFVFDILWLDGKSLLELTLTKRRQLLKKHFPKSKIVCFNECFDGTMGTALFEQAQKHGLEGIVAKKKDSEYFPGARTESWLKIKVAQHIDGIIVGYTKETERSRNFRRLLIAIPDGKKLKYVGAVGTGFNDKSFGKILSLLKPAKSSPFKEDPDPNKGTRFRKASADIIYWVKPEIKCLIRYQEITNEGVMRHPSFKGLIS